MNTLRLLLTLLMSLALPVNGYAALSAVTPCCESPATRSVPREKPGSPTVSTSPSSAPALHHQKTVSEPPSTGRCLDDLFAVFEPPL